MTANDKIMSFVRRWGFDRPHVGGIWGFALHLLVIGFLGAMAYLCGEFVATHRLRLFDLEGSRLALFIFIWGSSVLMGLAAATSAFVLLVRCVFVLPQLMGGPSLVADGQRHHPEDISEPASQFEGRSRYCARGDDLCIQKSERQPPKLLRAVVATRVVLTFSGALSLLILAVQYLGWPRWTWVFPFLLAVKITRVLLWLESDAMLRDTLYRLDRGVEEERPGKEDPQEKL